MTDKPRRGSVKRLVAMWSVYWTMLAVATLGKFAFAAWRALQMPPDHSSINASASDTGASLDVVVDGAKEWAGSASWITIALWIAVPAILIWAAWITERRRNDAIAAIDAIDAGADSRESLAAGSGVPYNRSHEKDRDALAERPRPDRVREGR